MQALRGAVDHESEDDVTPIQWTVCLRYAQFSVDHIDSHEITYWHFRWEKEDH